MVCLYNDQIQDYMQKISVLTQYIGNLTKFDKIRLKIEADQVCLERNFSKILLRYWKFGFSSEYKSFQLEKSWKDNPFT